MKTKAIITKNDPRNFDEFTKLKQEINKINHPEHLWVDWNEIEKLALILFNKNGIDFQTAIYYALAKTKNDELNGFTKGCEILAVLMKNHWQTFWPKENETRTILLEWFNGRASPDVRQFSIKKEDSFTVMRCKNALKIIKETLESNHIFPLPRIIFLLDFIDETDKKLKKQIIEENENKKINNKKQTNKIKKDKNETKIQPKITKNEPNKIPFRKKIKQFFENSIVKKTNKNHLWSILTIGIFTGLLIGCAVTIIFFFVIFLNLNN